MGLINLSTVHWQGPPIDIDHPLNLVVFDFVRRSFYLDSVVIKTGFLSGLQLFDSNNSLRLRVFSKKFRSYAEGIMTDDENNHVDDDDKNVVFFLKDKRPKISNTPGIIATNWNYNVFFGTSNQVGKKLKIKVLFRF